MSVKDDHLKPSVPPSPHLRKHHSRLTTPDYPENLVEPQFGENEGEEGGCCEKPELPSQSDIFLVAISRCSMSTTFLAATRHHPQGSDEHYCIYFMFDCSDLQDTHPTY